jgi:hypothetical protein
MLPQNFSCSAGDKTNKPLSTILGHIESAKQETGSIGSEHANAIAVPYTPTNIVSIPSTDAWSSALAAAPTADNDYDNDGIPNYVDATPNGTPVTLPIGGGGAYDGPDTSAQSNLAPQNATDGPDTSAQSNLAPQNAIDGPDTSVQTGAVAGGEPVSGAGNGGSAVGSTRPIYTTPPRTEAQKAADFDRMVSEYAAAKTQAAAGDPTKLQQLDAFFNVTRNPAEYTREFYMPKNGLSLIQNDAIALRHSLDDLNGDGLVSRKELNNEDVALQYDDAVWSDGGISSDEMVGLVQKRVQQGMVNNVDFQKADLGKAIDTLVGSSGYNRVFDAAQTSAIEAKLGNPLPDAIKADGRVSEQELTDYLAGRIKEGYLALDNGNFVSGSRVAEEAAINVAVSAPPVPTGEPADESGQGGWYQPSLPNTTDPTQSDYISPDDSYNPQASDSNTGLTYGEEYLGGVYQVPNQ